MSQTGARRRSEQKRTAGRPIGQKQRLGWAYEQGGTIGDPSAGDDFRPVLNELVSQCGRR
jgi:hypothetical protein